MTTIDEAFETVGQALTEAEANMAYEEHLAAGLVSLDLIRKRIEELETALNEIANQEVMGSETWLRMRGVARSALSAPSKESLVSDPE